MVLDALSCLIVEVSIVLKDSLVIENPLDLKLYRVTHAVNLLILNALFYRLDFFIVENVQFVFHVMKIAFNFETLELFLYSALGKDIL